MVKSKKPSIATLPWKALMKVGELKSDAETGKHADRQPWYDYVSSEKNMDSLMRHAGERCSGKLIDEESGLPVSVHIALRALMQAELDLRKQEERVEHLEDILIESDYEE